MVVTQWVAGLQVSGFTTHALVHDAMSAPSISALPALGIWLQKFVNKKLIVVLQWAYFLILSVGFSLYFTSCLTMGPDFEAMPLSGLLAGNVDVSIPSLTKGIISWRVLFSFFALSFMLSGIFFHRFIWLKYLQLESKAPVLPHVDKAMS